MKLNCSRNQLTCLPSEIGFLVNLTVLDCSRNQLTCLPPEIGSLVNLTELWCNKNQLTSLPPEIGFLVNLTTLDCNNNQLTILPSEIGFLVNLTELWCHKNPRLTSLPTSLKGLSFISNFDSDFGKPWIVIRQELREYEERSLIIGTILDEFLPGFPFYACPMEV